MAATAAAWEIEQAFERRRVEHRRRAQREDPLERAVGEDQLPLRLREHPLPDQMAGGHAGRALDVIVQAVRRHRQHVGVKADLALPTEMLLHQPLPDAAGK